MLIGVPPRAWYSLKGDDAGRRTAPGSYGGDNRREAHKLNSAGFVV